MPDDKFTYSSFEHQAPTPCKDRSLVQKMEITLFRIGCTTLLLLLVGFCEGSNLEKENLLESDLPNEGKEMVGYKRSPRFGLTIPLPAIPGIGELNHPGMNPNGQPVGGNGTTGGGPFETLATIGSSAVLIKGGILGTLAAIKSAILPPIFLSAVIIFLLAGAAFFGCSLIDCRGIINGTGPGFGGVGTTSNNPFNRNSYLTGPGSAYDNLYDFAENARPIFQAIDDGYQRYSQSQVQPVYSQPAPQPQLPYTTNNQISQAQISQQNQNQMNQIQKQSHKLS